MTLTFKTAKHAIDKYGKIYDIGDEEDILDDYSMARDEAEEINEHNPDFKPCIVVTTAREALEAAWELAYEVDMIPAGARYLQKWGEGDFSCFEQIGKPDRARDAVGDRDRRLLDEPQPEPWELSRYCYANGHIYERVCGTGTVYWVRPGSEIRYNREYFAPLSPRPVTIEGGTE